MYCTVKHDQLCVCVQMYICTPAVRSVCMHLCMVCGACVCWWELWSTSGRFVPYAHVVCLELLRGTMYVLNARIGLRVGRVVGYRVGCRVGYRVGRVVGYMGGQPDLKMPFIKCIYQNGIIKTSSW